MIGFLINNKPTHFLVNN